MPDRYPGVCQNPGCTREDGVCIGYHCPGCGKPTTSMGHPECAPPAEPPSRAMQNLQDAVTELRRCINAALALHAPHSATDQHCKECGVDVYENEIPWPCDTVRALQGDRPTTEEPKRPPWFVVRHCCESGAVAYPESCPWHPHRDVGVRDDTSEENR